MIVELPPLANEVVSTARSSPGLPPPRTLRTKDVVYHLRVGTLGVSGSISSFSNCWTTDLVKLLSKERNGQSFRQDGGS